MRLVWTTLLAAAAGATSTYLIMPATRGDLARPDAESRPAQPELAEISAPELRGIDANASEIARLRAQVRELRAEIQASAPSLPSSGPPGGSPLVVPTGDVEMLPAAELIALATKIRKHLQEVLLSPPEGVKLRYVNFLSKPETGVARLLPRGMYEQAIEKRGGGAYYSFATRDNSYDEEPDVELQQGHYSSSFYGGTWGYVMDLGAMPIEAVPDAPSSAPSGLTEKRRLIWELLWSDAGTGRNGYSDEFSRRAVEVGASRDSVEAQVGHAYVVRAILPGEHDHLVAFSPVEEDAHGQTLVWRILKSWPIAERRRSK